MEQKTTYITLSRVKGEFGFTDGLVRRYLPEPVIRKNPHYAKMPMYLWDLEIVREISERPDVRAELEKAEKRRCRARESLRPRMEEKRQQTRELYDLLAAEIRVERLPLDRLRKLAVQSKIDWYEWTDQWERALDAGNADEATVQRWMVNYVRHDLTSYDHDLLQGKGLIGNADARAAYADRLFRRIAETYPELEDEVERQRLRRQGETSFPFPDDFFS